MRRRVATVATKALATRAAATVIALAFTFMGHAPDAGAQSAPPQIAFDPSTTYQTINGWETTLYSAQDDASFPDFKGELFRRLVDDVGINRVRLEVRSGAEHSNDNWQDFVDGKIAYADFRPLQYATVNDNSDPDDLDMSGFHFGEIDSDVNTLLLPIKQRVEARGEKLHINLCYVAFTHLIGSSGGSYHHDDDPKEYAEFVLATFKHLKDTHGLVPDSYEMILEPDNTAEWRGTQIGNALVATEKKLRDNGFTPEFVAPSTTSMGNAVSYFDAMANVSGAVGVLTEYSYHRYGGVSTANLQAIASRAAQHGLRTAHLEHIGSGHDDLHADLAIGQNSAWQQFASASVVNDGSTYLWVDKSTSPPTIRLPSRTRYLKEYFLAARRGAVRVRATSTDGNFEPLAFVDADGRPAVVVKCASGGPFEVSGLPAGTYGIRYATSSVETGHHPDDTIAAGGIISTFAPGSGVTVVYAKQLAPPPVSPPEITASSPSGTSVTIDEGTAQTFSVTAQDPQSLPLTYAWTVDGTSAGTGAATFSYTASGVGPHTVAVTVDNGTEQATRSWDVTVEEPPAAPSIAFSAPTSGADHATAAATVDIEGTASDDDGLVEVTWTNDRGGSGAAAGTASWSVAGVPLSPGANVLTVTARDVSGLTASASLTVRRDVQDPTVSVTDPPGGADVITVAVSVPLAGTASDDHAIDRVTWANGGSGSGTADGTTTWSVDAVPLAPGRNDVTVRAHDDSGRTASAGVTVFRDMASPSIAVSSPTSEAVWATFEPSVSLGGAASDDVVVQSVAWTNDRGGSGAAAGAATWTTVPIALAPGDNVLTVTVTDAVGRTASASLVVSRGDPTPSVTITSPVATGSFVTARAEVTLSGNAAAALGLASVAWRDDRGNSGTANGTTDWSATVPLAEGPTVVTVTASDGDGHSAETSIAVEYRRATLRLVPGYNLVSLPSSPVPPLRASDFVAACAAAGADPVAVIDPLGGDAGVRTAAGGGADFLLTAGRAYFVRCRAAATVPVPGDALSPAPVRVSLRKGMNFVGLPVLAGGPRTAASVAADVEADGGRVLSVRRWRDGAAEPYVPGRGGDGFDLLPGEGFVLVCDRDSVWEVAP